MLLRVMLPKVMGRVGFGGEVGRGELGTVVVD
jgi:hypothetical protein